MTTEHASKETKTPKTEKPKPAFSAETGQEIEAPAPLPTFALTAERILYLQRTVGNRAVQRMIAASSLSAPTLQRDAAAPKGGQKGSAGNTLKVNVDDAEKALEAASGILQGGSLDLIDKAPSMFQDSLRLLSMARNGWGVNSSPQERTDLLDEALGELKPAYTVNKDNQAYYREEIMPRVARLREGLALQAAEKRIDNALLTPGQDKVVELPSEGLNDDQAKEYAKLLVPKLGMLKELSITVAEKVLEYKAEEFEEVFKDMAKGQSVEMPETELRLFKNPTSLLQVQATIDLITSALSIPENAKEFSEKIGLGKVASLTEFLLNATHLVTGITSNLLLLSARVFKLSGNLEVANRLTGLVGVGMKSVGEVISYIEIAHSAMVLLDPYASNEAKFDAGVAGAETALGIGLRLGALGSLILSFSVGVNLMIFRAELAAMGELSAELVTTGLQPVFDYMSNAHKGIKEEMEYLIKASLILKSEKDANKQKALVDIVEASTHYLNTQVDNFLNDCVFTGYMADYNKPGNIPPIRAKFAPLLSLKGPVNDPDAALSKAEKVVKTIKEIFDDAQNYVRLSMGMERQVDLFPDAKAKKEKKKQEKE